MTQLEKARREIARNEGRIELLAMLAKDDRRIAINQQQYHVDELETCPYCGVYYVDTNPDCPIVAHG